MGGNEEFWRRGSWRGRDELRGGNPSGGRRVLSDRLGLCNRVCVCACVCWPLVSSQMCLQLLLLSQCNAVEVVREHSTFILQFLYFPAIVLETVLMVS